MAGLSDTRVRAVDISAFTVPTDAPEADGTIEWDSTTLVLAEVSAGGVTGLGYSYAAPAAAVYARDKLAAVLGGRDAMDIPGAHAAMLRAVRNDGRPGIASAALSALDAALWDVKARLLAVPLCALLGRARSRVPLYGSGGFTSYDDDRLTGQLGGWAAAGFAFVKMKTGADIDRDTERVRVARQAIGPRCRLFVDANGALDRNGATLAAHRFAEHDVRWFEEPVSSDDLDGLAALRARAPAGMAIAAGEYGYDTWYFRRMLAAGAVDALQADATRCGGITGFLRAAEIARAFHVPLSSHTAPSLHLAACCALDHVAHMEWFHDHVRIEQMLFEGAAQARDGHARPDLARPGLGLSLRRDVAARHAVDR